MANCGVYAAQEPMGKMPLTAARGPERARKGGIPPVPCAKRPVPGRGCS